MKGILVVFMTKYLLDTSGARAPMSDTEATIWYHAFVMAVYFFPIAGAILSDAFWGKYRTILTLSIVYCLGHLALALDLTRVGLFLGLALISIGSGGIKPCVSAHVGDQFGKSNEHLLSRVFAWFYLSINVGAAISTMLTPALLSSERWGPHWAFGIPGALMVAATFVFWLGRNRFVHVPPSGWRSVWQTVTSPDGLTAIRNLTVIYLFVAVFWSMFDQTGSTWVLQAERMDRTWHVAGWFPGWMNAASWLPAQLQTVELLPAQIQTANPVLILILVPLFAYVVYPLINLVFPLTPLRKIGLGFLLCSASFAIVAWTQRLIDAGQRPDIGWQLLAYIVLTASEVMVSITGLEFSYTQAPKPMKSFVMSLWLLSVAVGNAVTTGVNYAILKEDGSSRLAGDDYFWFFSLLMLATAVVFVVFAMRYRGKSYIQDEAPVVAADGRDPEAAGNRAE